MPPDTAAREQLSAIAGFRLVTADLPRLRQFYQEVLGFAVEGLEQMIATDELALLGVRGSGLRQAMRLGEQVVSIDRYEYAGRAYPDQGDAASLWFQHLALVVADMAPAYRRVAAAKPISAEYLPAASGGVHAFKFRDPDGYPLELLQFPAGSVGGRRTDRPWYRPCGYQRCGCGGQPGLLRRARTRAGQADALSESVIAPAA